MSLPEFLALWLALSILLGPIVGRFLRGAGR